MITITDIYKGMCSFLKSNTDIALEDGDVEEPVIRPAFKVLIERIQSGLFSSMLRELKIKFNIIYFSKARDRPNVEFLETEQLLSEIFLEPVKLAERCAVYVDALDFERFKNGILKCSFEIEIMTRFKDESELKEMERLEAEFTMTNIKTGKFNFTEGSDEDEEDEGEDDSADGDEDSDEESGSNSDGS